MNSEVRWSAGVAKKAARGDDLETPLAKKGFSGDGGRGRFAKGSAKAQVTDELFSDEEIIHPVIVTAGAVFGQSSSLPRPFLASGLPNPSPRSHFLAIRANFALGGNNLKRLRCQLCTILLARFDPAGSNLVSKSRSLIAPGQKSPTW